MAESRQPGRRRKRGPQGGQGRRHGKSSGAGHRRTATKPNAAPASGGVPSAPPGPVEGVLELNERGVGALRDPKRNLAKRGGDVQLDANVIQKLGLRGGELLTGEVEGNGTLRVDAVDGAAIVDWSPPTPLEDTTAIDPEQPLHFSTEGGPLTMRIVDLFTPVGFGQRALIVAPPRTGKTILLQQMAHGVATNHPAAYMIVLLVDERPEEVTEMRRNVNGEVFASSNDHDAAAHIRLTRLVMERARRLVESGRDIIVLLDSITRLARAFNTSQSSSGRTMTGGLDIRALQEPKQIFGAARKVENGGSLTIIGTSLVETGSRADDFIFQEFKGTGNMELKLDRELANLRLWPAIDLRQSGTRKEEKLLGEDALNKVNRMRRQLYDLPKPKQIELLQDRMGKHESVDAFLASIRT